MNKMSITNGTAIGLSIAIMIGTMIGIRTVTEIMLITLDHNHDEIQSVAGSVML